MAFIPFNNLTETEKSDAVERLIGQSTPNQDFFFMMLLAVLMASFGILIGSITVLIGSMLIAPLLYPFLSLSLGITISDYNLISRSLKTILKAMVLVIAASFLVTILFSGGKINTEIIQTLQPSYLFMGVAIIAGFAATFATVKPKLNETLPGIVIAVALIPPLALMGIGGAQWDWEFVSNSLVLFLLNAIGIVFASMVTFSLMRFYPKRAVAKETIKEEEKKLEMEKKKDMELEKEKT